MAQAGSAPAWAPSENTVASVLLLLDLLGVFVIFNLAYWWVTGGVPPDLLLNWKLFMIAGFTLLAFQTLDLYTFNSTVSSLGMLERSVVAVTLIAVAVAISVYIIGPRFIGGFVGRGVMGSSLIALWLWSLGLRYLLNQWMYVYRGQIQWLVLINEANLDRFVSHFRAIYMREKLWLLMQEGGEPRELDEHTRIIGTWDDLQQAVRDRDIAGIVVVSRSSLPDALVQQLLAIRIRGVRVYDLNDFYEKFLSCLPVFNLDQNWLAMTLGFDLIHNPIGLRSKRLADIVLALLLGLLLVPLLLCLAIAILVTSGPPILFNQRRRGENNRDFIVHKFRTMVVGAEPDGARFAEVNDPRITLIGHLLRKFRLDELPQLWNVLIGEMSFIGPRPERPELIAALRQQIPYYDLRHLVKPGITGWAQVMHGYGDSTEDAIEKLQYDLFYIKNYSIVLDIAIIVRSAKVILFGTGR